MKGNEGMNHTQMKTWQSILTGVVIGFLCGVGTMQATLIGDSHDHSTRIKQLEHADNVMQTAFEKRMDSMANLWMAKLEADRELISLVRQQVAMLDREHAAHQQQQRP